LAHSNHGPNDPIKAVLEISLNEKDHYLFL
jgi:hypothetical protein